MRNDKNLISLNNIITNPNIIWRVRWGSSIFEFSNIKTNKNCCTVKIQKCMLSGRERRRKKINRINLPYVMKYFRFSSFTPFSTRTSKFFFSEFHFLEGIRIGSREFNKLQNKNCRRTFRTRANRPFSVFFH